MRSDASSRRSPVVHQNITGGKKNNILITKGAQMHRRVWQNLAAVAFHSRWVRLLFDIAKRQEFDVRARTESSAAASLLKRELDVF